MLGERSSDTHASTVDDTLSGQQTSHRHCPTDAYLRGWGPVPGQSLKPPSGTTATPHSSSSLARVQSSGVGRRRRTRPRRGPDSRRDGDARSRGRPETEDVRGDDVATRFEAVQCVPSESSLADVTRSREEDLFSGLSSEGRTEARREFFDLALAVREFPREVRVVGDAGIGDHRNRPDVVSGANMKQSVNSGSFEASLTTEFTSENIVISSTMIHSGCGHW